MKIIKVLYLFAFFLSGQSLIANDIIRPDNIEEDIGALKDNPTIPEQVKKGLCYYLINNSIISDSEPIILRHKDPVNSVQFNPKDSNKLATGSNNIVILWDVATGKPFKALGVDSYVKSVAWSLDGTQLAMGSGKLARAWNITSGFRKIFKHDGEVNSVAWSPDGTMLATGSRDKTAKIWDVVTGDLFREFKHDGEVNSVSWSPDGEQLATGSRDKTAKIWDVADGKLLKTFKEGWAVSSVAWSPDGKKLAAGVLGFARGVAKIWDVANGELLQIMEHGFAVASVAWSSDSTKLATVARNKALLWNVGTGKLLKTFDNVCLDVRSVAWSPDGTELATGSEDATAKIWTVCDFTHYRPIDYQVLYFLKQQNELGNPIDAAQFPALQNIVDTASMPMQIMMKNFIRITLPEGFKVTDKDDFFNASFQILMDRQFEKNKAFIVAAVPARTKYNFYEADGLNIRLFNLKLYADQLAKKLGSQRNPIDPKEVLYFITTKENPEFTYIGSLEDLMQNNEQGKKMRALLDAAYKE